MNLDQALQQTAARQRWLRAWEGLWEGLLAGALLYLTVLAAFKALPLDGRALLVAAAAGVGAMGIAAARRAWRPVARRDAARWLDAREGLAERLGTAVEVGEAAPAATPTEEAWRRLVVADASAAAARLQPRKLLPVRLPRSARLVLAALAVTAGLTFAPEYRSPALARRQRHAEVMKDVGRNLENLTRRAVQRRPAVLEPTRKALDEVQEIGQKLQQAKLTTDSALKDLSKVTERLQQQADELARNPAVKQLAQAARSESGASSDDSSPLQKKVDALEKQLGAAADHPAEIDKLQAKLDQLKAAAQAAISGPPGAAEAAKDQLSKMAGDLAKLAQSAGTPLPSLDQAIDALKNAQVEQFLRDLNTADLDLKRLSELSKALAEMRQQAEKLGKDLPEQLKQGQAETAIQSLEKMRAALAAQPLTAEQIQKLLDELQRAVPVAKFSEPLQAALKGAGDHLKAGKLGDSSKSMAAAEGELRRLMDQLGDAQSLSAAIGNLEKAGLCLSNESLWSGGGTPGQPKVGLTPSKGGRGVGTWSDSSAWAMADHIDDQWDNSGITRPDLKGRGQTERDTGLNNGFVPTKVKGSLQPGAPMPSITLKGVSLKGQSHVEYVAADAAAQSDEQAAQNQDKVPRAYRNAVRDYFDDHKP